MMNGILGYLSISYMRRKEEPGEEAMRDTNRRSEFPAAHSPFHGGPGDKALSLQASWWARACAAIVLWAAAATALPAQTLITILNFNGANGAGPYAALVQSDDGTLYGTTQNGGANGDGAAFEISPDDVFKFLYSFCSIGTCDDGASPLASMTLATNSYLYGVTTSDGADGPYGTIFRVAPTGVLTTLLSFDGADGETPYGALVQATNGNLYGTTGYGGVNLSGTVFKTTLAGALTTVYSFCSKTNCTDGEIPSAGLVQGTDGNFYGTTEYGGMYGFGTAFKVTPGGALTTLYTFCSNGDCTDGANPAAVLIQAADGNFYGTTHQGGANNRGTVFKLSSTGKFTTLYSFCSNNGCSDGLQPYAPLVQATDGNFYGTTTGGGANAGGTIFKITNTGALTSLYSFCSQTGCADGSEPFAGLVQDTNGSFYGVTYSGGTSTACSGGCGTVFSLTVGLGPFVKTLPTSGRVTARVGILGTNLSGATSVTFNGTPATFTVKSSSLITTTVPAGATTGTVQVVVPSGTLSSNVPFRVLP